MFVCFFTIREWQRELKVVVISVVRIYTSSSLSRADSSLSKVVWQLCHVFYMLSFSDRELDHSDWWLTYWARAQMSSLWWQGTWWDNSSSPAVCHLFQTLASTLPFSTCKAISPAWYSCCRESWEPVLWPLYEWQSWSVSLMPGFTALKHCLLLCNK